jgi:hypothetical protein
MMKTPQNRDSALLLPPGAVLASGNDATMPLAVDLHDALHVGARRQWAVDLHDALHVWARRQ